jgi:type IV secretory pathway VirB2 component (pilin)
VKTAIGREFLLILTTARAVLLPVPCQAASAALPWDRALTSMQDELVGTVAPAAIGLALAGAAILYALGSCDKQAARLVGAGIGGGVALVIVHLLNYVLT